VFASFSLTRVAGREALRIADTLRPTGLVGFAHGVHTGAYRAQVPGLAGVQLDHLVGLVHGVVALVTAHGSSPGSMDCALPGSEAMPHTFPVQSVLSLLAGFPTCGKAGVVWQEDKPLPTVKMVPK